MLELLRENPFDYTDAVNGNSVIITVPKKDGKIVAFCFISASPDDPSVSHWLNFGDFIDEDGGWHGDGLPDGVASYDPDRLIKVPVFYIDDDDSDVSDA